MTQATTTPPAVTIGIDLGDRKSHICSLDAAGEVTEESQISTKPKSLRARFEGLTPRRIAELPTRTFCTLGDEFSTASAGERGPEHPFARA